MELREPQRKRRVYVPYSQPFPIPIESETGIPAGKALWQVYTGHLNGDCVVLDNKDEMFSIYKMGFFGKGSLSRSRPRKVESEVPHFLRERQWLQHHKWASNAEGGEVLHNPPPLGAVKKPELVDDQLLTIYENISSDESTNKKVNNEEDDRSGSNDDSFKSDDCVEILNSSNVSSRKLKDTASGDLCDIVVLEIVDGEPEEDCKVNEKKTAADTPRKRRKASNEADIIILDRQDTAAVEPAKKEAKTYLVTGSTDTSADEDILILDDTVKLTGNKNTNHRRQTKPVVTIDDKDDDEIMILHDKEKECMILDRESEGLVTQNSVEKENTSRTKQAKQIVEIMDVSDEIVNHSDRNQITKIEESCERIQEVVVNKEVVNTVNSFSASNDLNKTKGNVVVLPDSDDEDEKYLTNLTPRLEKDPFQVYENLHLTLEEAFFLSFGLGCLQVVDLSGSVMSLPEMWKCFCDYQKDFVQKYIAYHYYRSKGWVVKPGLKFGGDFLLYKKGPPFYHASYIVMVEVLDKASLKHIPERTRQSLSLNRLVGFNRLAESASKEVLLCQVLWPSDVPHQEQPTISSIPKFTIHQLLLRRWISSQEREQPSEDEV